MKIAKVRYLGQNYMVGSGVSGAAGEWCCWNVHIIQSLNTKSTKVAENNHIDLFSEFLLFFRKSRNFLDLIFRDGQCLKT